MLVHLTCVTCVRLCHHDMEGRGGGGRRGTARYDSVTRMRGTCVTCASCATMTWRGGGHRKVCRDTCRDIGKLRRFLEKRVFAQRKNVSTDVFINWPCKVNK